ncbi:MAG: 2OG-Fe(II) oxygenase, partial [Planctomycetaceae bacterium]
MSTATIGTPNPFFIVMDIAAAEADEYNGAIEQLRTGAVTGIIVRQVYDAEFMNEIVRRLDDHDPPFLKTWFPEKFKSWFYGQNLNLMESSPEAYFSSADLFHQQLQLLFPGDRGLDTHLMNVLSRLDGKRRYLAAPGPESDQTYMLTTFRGHGEGGYIPAHCDNEQSLRPAYMHLQTLVSSCMYSMVLLIGKPAGGGELEVFDYRVEPQHARLMNDDAVTEKPDLNKLSSCTLTLDPGDLIIVDSGRYLHRVTPVVGT